MLKFSAKTGRAFGSVLHDIFDPRDHVSTPPRAAASTATICDLEPWCGPVKDQGNEGACTGFAYAGMREFLFRKYHQWEKQKELAPELAIFSPQFIYYKEREIEGTVYQDGGAQPRTGAKVINQIGVCLETSLPYEAGKFTVEPTEEQITEAARFKCGSYHRIIGGVPDMRSVLVSQYVFTIGLQLYESFEGDDVARTGLVPMPNVHKEQCLGGHEVLVIGCDDTKMLHDNSSGRAIQGAFKIRNSWGQNWGDHGNFWIPYLYLADKNLTWDPWIAHLGPSWGKAPAASVE